MSSWARSGRPSRPDEDNQLHIAVTFGTPPRDWIDPNLKLMDIL